jgi:hypothetical protein
MALRVWDRRGFTLQSSVNDWVTGNWDPLFNFVAVGQVGIMYYTIIR